MLTVAEDGPCVAMGIQEDVLEHLLNPKYTKKKLAAKAFRLTSIKTTIQLLNALMDEGVSHVLKIVPTGRVAIACEEIIARLQRGRW